MTIFMVQIPSFRSVGHLRPHRAAKRVENRAAFLQFILQIYTFVPETANAEPKNSELMPTWLILILCAVAAVGFFVLGMSLTLMIKGHFIDSEISTNKNMQRLGIKCAVQETREADGTAQCSGTSVLPGCSGNCGACDIEHR